MTSRELLEIDTTAAQKRVAPHSAASALDDGLFAGVDEYTRGRSASTGGEVVPPAEGDGRDEQDDAGAASGGVAGGEIVAEASADISIGETMEKMFDFLYGMAVSGGSWLKSGSCIYVHVHVYTTLSTHYHQCLHSCVDALAIRSSFIHSFIRACMLRSPSSPRSRRT